MPYIKKDRRGKVPETAGELNYAITKFVMAYLHRKGVSYQSMNDIMGALRGVELEFYRRVVSCYENHKIRENGDVYFEEEP